MILDWILMARFKESCGLIKEAGYELWGMVYPKLEG